MDRSEIEIFTDLPTREQQPTGPFLTVATKKRIIYFDGAASQILRTAGATHVQFGAAKASGGMPKASVAFLLVCEEDERGAIPLAGGVRGKGPGTFQLPKEALSFFSKHQAISGEKQRYPLEWRDDIRGFQFRLG